MALTTRLGTIAKLIKMAQEEKRIHINDIIKKKGIHMKDIIISFANFSNIL